MSDRVYKCEISDDLQRELKFYCYQYKERELKANQLLGLKGVQMSSEPSGGGVGDPTSKSAELRERYLADNELIRQTARLVTCYCPCNYKPLLKSVTTRTGSERCNYVCGKNQFSKLRREFFIQLAKALGKI